MPQKTSIEWTDYSSNPIYAVDKITGKRGWHCSHVSEGCRNCYAEAINKRFGTGREYTAQNDHSVIFELSMKECDALLKLDARLHRKGEVKKVFVGDMLDIFHHAIPLHLLDELFSLAARCNSLIFQILTKRTDLAYNYFDSTNARAYYNLPNLWLGFSAEDQQTFDSRWFHMKELSQFAVTFASLEPLLSPIILPPDFLALGRRGQAIIGGESGHNARPFNIEWARQIISQCRAANVPVFMKQLGSKPESLVDHITHKGSKTKKPDGFYRYLNNKKGGDPSEWPNDLIVRDFPE